MAGPNGQTYQLRTLADVFAMGDADRVQRAMEELTQGMVDALRTLDLIQTIAKGMGGEAIPTSWPDTIDWTDDGKGITEIRYRTTDGDAFLTTRRGR